MDVPTIYLDYWPVLLMTALAFVFAAGVVILSALLTARRPNPTKQEPYECGMPPLGPARVQISVKFYLVALLFLLFDVETVFILLWAVTFRNPSLRVFSLVEMAIFIGILLVGLAYAWRKGALKWS